MNKTKKLLSCVSLFLACICLIVISGCAEKTAGVSVSEDRMVIDGISWTYDPDTDAGLYETDESLGELSGEVSYEVYKVKGDDSLLICRNRNDTKVFRKEYRDMNTEIRTAVTSDGTMDYFCFGNEQGEAFVVLPGLSLKSVMGSADAIVNAYMSMADDYHVYFFDRIREFPDGYDIAAMADDTLEAFQEAGIEKAHIMGVSQGGMIAQMMALKDADAVSSLILCSSASRIPESAKTGFEKWHTLAEQKDTRGLGEAFGEAVYSPAFYEKYKEIIVSSAEGATDLDFANFVKSIEGTKDFDVYDRLDEIKCPVSVIGAGEDRVLGVQSSKEIIEKLGCPSFIYEGYGHGVYDEAPDYLDHVRELLKAE